MPKKCLVGPVPAHQEVWLDRVGWTQEAAWLRHRRLLDHSSISTGVLFGRNRGSGLEWPSGSISTLPLSDDVIVDEQLLLSRDFFFFEFDVMIMYFMMLT